MIQNRSGTVRIMVSKKIPSFIELESLLPHLQNPIKGL
jgi:hypothetical protein